MSNRRERTLQDLCDATPTLSQPQVTSENSKSFSSCSPRSQKSDYKGKPGTCNVCFAPCSSCFHADKVLLISNNEFAGETCAGNTETGQLSILSTVGGMDSTSDSISENAAGKASSRMSNASASDDSVVHTKSENLRYPEGHDDCLSCVSGTDEYANKKSDTGDSGIKHKKQRKITGETSDKVPSPSSLQTGIGSHKSGMVRISCTKSTDDATDLLKVRTTTSQAHSGKYLSHEQNPGDVKDETSDTKEEPLKVSTEHLNSSSPSGVASDVVRGDPPTAGLNSSKKNNDMEVEIHSADETDDLEMEQDVKVCDICGDAGREDLLAVCCRCSDGAEHTYCMQEMLDKVPEREWLCEECKSTELVENGRQEKIQRIDENEKNNSSSQASENLSSSDVEGQRTKCSTKIPCKRLRDGDDFEVSSVAKNPALESIAGSPKTSNSSKTAALSRDNSMKNLDRGRLESSHHSSADAVPVNDATESGKFASDLRLPNFRGTYLKSNSFNLLNSKPKVKLVDQVVIQRQKSAKEHGSFCLKEGVISKSMSFKSTNSSRPESKVKMSSSRLSQLLDNKVAKERSTFEYQHSFRTEHPSTNPMMDTSVSSTSRINKRPASRVEASNSIANHHEMKPLQTVGKAASLSRSSSLAARKTAHFSNSTGEFKGPLTYGHNTLGVSSSTDRVNNINLKDNQTSLKHDSFSEKSSFNANEGLPDGSPRSKDLTDSGDRMREYSGSRFGPASVKSSRDESDNLKAAIEAAILRKPGIHRKHKVPRQSDDSSVPTGGYEVASHQDHISGARKKKSACHAGMPTLSWNSTGDSLKEETLNNVNQCSLVPVEFLSSGERDGVHIDPSRRNVFSNIPAAMPLFLKSMAIPEHEYIWQGSFEICRSGQIFDSWHGIQAHLSTYASPKVIEAVNKFKSRVVLYEIPRLSTWPVQFQENGVREDNIALFFFAKDLESHAKSYKVLLDNMMKNDLALKGNIGGVELLIFASNQLPDNLQRWNMLFYLWGVFRGKKESCQQQMPQSLTQHCASQNIPQPIMSLPDNRCSSKRITENESEDAVPVLEVPASEEFRSLLSSRFVKRVCDSEGSSLDQLDHGLNYSSSSAVQSNAAKQSQDMIGTHQERVISSSCSLPNAVRSSSSGKEQMAMKLVAPLDRQQLPDRSSKSVAGTPKACISEGTTLNKTCDQNQVKLRMDTRDLSTDGETPLEDVQKTRDLNMDYDRWSFIHKESVMPCTFYAGASQVSCRNDDVYNETCGALEQLNHVPSGSLKNRHGEASIGTLTPQSFENTERHFFPVESKIVKGIPLPDGSMPWKMCPIEEDQLSDRAPNLELALGAERTPLTLGVEPLLISKVDQKVHDEHILEEAGSKAEDDVSASLSLSLSFPFPDKELSTKTAPKTEQLVTQRKRVNTSSMLFFGNVRDN